MPASTIEKPAPSKLKRAIRNAFTPILPMAVYRILKFRIQIGHFPNLRNPKSYNEKLLYKTLYDRREILTLFADKYRVRDYVRQKVGGDITFPETYAVYENWQDITLDGLPPSFVMKPNHGSGWALLVRDGDVPDIAEIRRLARQWLSGNFYTYTKEWCYQSIKPVILFEEFLTDRGERPDDVKFWCFNGKPDLVRFRPNPVSGRGSAFYDANWNKVYAA
ncbi:MAG TPA: ATP-grasp fold amidoligase family protein, partial [Chloroflexota bacterium]|nr:ATP-grasp fold amidoligase family protein [Chloroflexota bacterium]